MSAIWGVLTKDSTIDMKKKEELLRESYSHCIIDRTEYYVGEHVALGCGIQYFTPEAQAETLPIADEANGIYFTADVVLDNREELLKRLGYTSDDKSIPDGKILFDMFHKYKEACLNDLLGAYSIAYYDGNKNELYLVADSTGTRSLHYFRQGNTLYFSTLIEPIVKASGAKEINEAWITDFLAMDNMALAITYDETPYKDICRVPASHYLKITADKVEKVCYWNPTVEDIRYPSEGEYKKNLKEMFRESVKCLLRNDNMTMLLSGGMDSSSVACFAARETAAMGKMLTSFTSVPEKDFQSNLSDYYVTDESQAVLKTQKFLEEKGLKIDCKFIDLAGRNSWDDRIEELRAMEIPYKSMQNLLWIKEGMKKSYEMGARIMLTGSYGNVTISNSFPTVYQYELIRKFRWITFLKDCNRNRKRYKVGIKRAIRIAGRTVLDSMKKPQYPDIKITVGKSFIKDELLEQCEFESRFNKDYEKYIWAQYSGREAKKLIKNDKIFYQVGETQTKHSLATGVLLRDPTMNKRLIELCMHFPIACYSQEGVTRRLVREYFADELPEHVVKQGHYGLQSADTALRLQKDGERIFTEIEQLLKRPEAGNIINTSNALEALEQIKSFNKPDKNFEVLRLEYTAMVIEYISDRIADGRFVAKGRK